MSDKIYFHQALSGKPEEECGTWTSEKCIKFISVLQESQFQDQSDSLVCKVFNSAFDPSPCISAVLGGHSPTGLAPSSEIDQIDFLKQSDFCSLVEDILLHSSRPLTIEFPAFALSVSENCFFPMTAPKALGDEGNACYSPAGQGSVLYVTGQGAYWPPHLCCRQATCQLSLLVLSGEVVVFTWDVFNTELLKNLTGAGENILKSNSKIYLLKQGERLHIISPGMYSIISTKISVILTTPWIDVSDFEHVRMVLEAFCATSLPVQVPDRLKDEFVSKRQQYLFSTCPAMFTPVYRNPTHLLLPMKKGEISMHTQR